MKKTPPLEGLMYGKVENWHSSMSNDVVGYSEALTTDIEKGNIITSMVTEKVTHHKIVIDLDLPAKLIPSSTPGHFHLYIDHVMEKDAYFKLLAALMEAGLIEEGYYHASMARGYSAARLPWIKKDEAQ